MQIKIRGNNHTVTVRGQGTKAITIGLGTLMEKTLSDRFFENFELFSSDLYWSKSAGNKEIKSLELPEMLSDIHDLITQTNLEKPLIIAHSSFGILALEYAKLNPDSISGIVMIGTPINSNCKVGAHNHEIFLTEASEERKKVYHDREKEKYTVTVSFKNSMEEFIYSYCNLQSPKYWHNPEYDCTHLWDGIENSAVFYYLFSDILPKLDVQENIETLKTPIFLASGLNDYDCCPWEWDNLPSLPQNFTNIHFEKSGHWPHFEESDKFDTELVKWVNEHEIQ